jgi:hypothetical protein
MIVLTRRQLEPDLHKNLDYIRRVDQLYGE